MRKTWNVVVALGTTSVLAAAGCGSVEPRLAYRPAPPEPRLTEAQAVAVLKAMNPETAERDAGAALERGDTRFLMIYGYAPDSPGVTADLPDRFGYRLIDGTGDALSPGLTMADVARYLDYIQRYNHELARRFGRTDAMLFPAPLDVIPD